MNVAEILKKERVDLSLSAKTKEEALEQLTDLLYNSNAITDKKAFLEDVMERENISTTGIGNGIAIPHGKSIHVKETAVAIGRILNGIEWESVDGNTVKFIILLAVKENDKSGVHIKLLSQMARKLASEETCKKLLEAGTTAEIVDIFSK